MRKDVRTGVIDVIELLYKSARYPYIDIKVKVNGDRDFRTQIPPVPGILELLNEGDSVNILYVTKERRNIFGKKRFVTERYLLVGGKRIREDRFFYM
jgi:hypothetical protein